MTEREPTRFPMSRSLLKMTRQVINDHSASFRKAAAAGVNIAMGTDSGVGRHGENTRELELMVNNGLTPMQSIVASTLGAAKLLRLDQRLGTLAVGKLADTCWS